MPLDPQAQRILDELAVSGGVTRIDRQPPQQVRDAHACRARPPGPSMEVQDVIVRGTAAPELPLRFYYPASSGRLPGMVFFHGGGFVFGSIETADTLCRVLSAATGCCVVSVGYRLAPEAKFPAAVLDAYAALSYVHENAFEHRIDHMRLGVAGSSAGANLATVAARQSKERRGPGLCFQVLYYPVADLRKMDTPSYREFADGPYLSRAEMVYCRGHYLPDEASRSDPAASPLVARNLIGMPPAYVVTAECDPLRDEGEAYAQALRAAGTEVSLRRAAGQFHGFLGFYDRLDAARQILTETAAFVAARTRPGA